MREALPISSVVPYGDHAVLVAFEPGHLPVIHAITQQLIARPLADLENVIPAVDSLVMVFKQPITLSDSWLNELQAELSAIEVPAITSVHHQLPVCYHPDIAPDLNHVLSSLALKLDDFIDWHASNKLTVDMLGFLPGFAYLSGQDSSLNMPRKDSPSLQVPAGSVALGGQHTGIYTLSTPGGWHVVGRTPTPLLELGLERPTLVLNPMDTIQIEPISLAEYDSLTGQADP